MTTTCKFGLTPDENASSTPAVLVFFKLSGRTNERTKTSKRVDFHENKAGYIPAALSRAIVALLSSFVFDGSRSAQYATSYLTERTYGWTDIVTTRSRGKRLFYANRNGVISKSGWKTGKGLQIE